MTRFSSRWRAVWQRRYDNNNVLVIVNTSSNAEYTVPLPYPGKWLTQFEDDPSPAEEQSLVIAPRQAYILRKEGTN